MKIAYILGEFPCLTETFIEREIEAVERQGVEVIVFALRHGEGESALQQRKLAAGQLFYRPSFMPRRLPSLTVASAYWLRPLMLLDSWLAMQAAPYFARVMKEQGIGHVHAHFASLPGTVAWAMRRDAGIPYSLSMHARDIFVKDELLGEKLKGAEFVVTCTEFGRRYLCERYPELPPDKLATVYHGLPLAQYRRAGLPRADEPIILAAGRLIEKKGFELLIRACALLRDQGRKFRCQIVGEGEERGRLEALIADLRLQEAVELVGALPHDEVVKRLDAATVFVMPSVIASDGDRDGLPNVLLEALAMEVPSVASNVSAIPELIRDGETGLLVPPR
ncbi:MAG: colanic acid biosynthesis glycosyltransferase WcaL, partial [Planctomycetes bacterium]|nr:colanic acid biosynthesis glycosyltransferase WcaL [Planctomycetota bacterium]